MGTTGEGTGQWVGQGNMDHQRGNWSSVVLNQETKDRASIHVVSKSVICC